MPNPQILQIAIPVAIAVIAVLVIILLGYVKAPPDQAYIISGLKKESKVLIGRAGIRVPIFERLDKLYLGQMTVDIKTEQSVPTSDFINVNVDAVAKVRISPLADGIKLVIPTTEQVRFRQEGAAGDESEVDTAGQAEANPAAEYGVLDGQEEILDDTASSADGKININTATKEQLCEIPGIGATRAAAIEAYRQQAGSFASIEDIMKVSGIKEGTYAKIKDYIKVK